MNWQHLIYFRTVAEMKSFSNAAAALYITPSALSKAIRNLEMELEFPLFQRVGRSSSLTSYGEQFYECVCDASNDITACIQEIHADMGVMRGRICVGGNYTMCAEFLPPKIKELKNIYPDIRVNLCYYTTDVVLQHLLDGSVHLGFCSEYDPSYKAYAKLDRFYIKSDELCVFVSKEHELAKEEAVPFAALKKENFVVQKNSNVGSNLVFRRLCQKHGIVPNIAVEAPDDQSILSLVENNLGVAMLARSPSLQREGLHALRILEDTPPLRHQFMVWNKEAELPAAVRTFQELIRGTVDTHSP